MASKVKYELNLITAFDKAFSDKSSALRSKLKPLISDPQVKRAIGRAVVERIEKNTRNQLDRDGNKFVGAPDEDGRRYSQSYVNSVTFKVNGKSPTVINLVLTSAMVNSMVVTTPGSSIRVSMADQKNNDKAHGHINGTRHKKTGKRMLPVRDFLGLPVDEEREIVKSVVNKASSDRTELDIGDVAAFFADGFFGEE